VTEQRSRTVSAVRALACVCALLAAERSQASSNDLRGDAAPALTPEATRAASVLRMARRDRDRPVEELARELRAIGADVVEPLLDTLQHSAVPATAPDEPAQLLSVRQREVVLRGLQQFSAGPTLRSIQARLSATPNLSTRVATLWVYSAVGGVSELAHGLDCAMQSNEPKIHARADEALRAAVTGILTREPRAFDGLASRVLNAPHALHGPLVFAIGAARDSRGQETFARLLATREELLDVVVAQVRLLGAPADPEVRELLGGELQAALATNRPQLVAAACRALGEIEDEDALPQLIELLSSEELTVRESAHWALKRCSRLNLSARADAWTRWYEGQAQWWETRAGKLLENLVDGQRVERLLALEELAEASIYRDEIVEHVAPLLADGDTLIRRRACDALRELGMRNAAPALLHALEDSDSEVRIKSRGALEALYGRALPEDPAECRGALRL
jgi:hypothetical protein